MEFEFDKEMDSLLRQTAKGDLFATTTPTEHIDADEISMFAENALPEKAKPRVMKHLADCDKCRTILSNVIVLNAEAENEVIVTPAQETKAETVVTSTEPSWFQKIFSTKNLAFSMGALALIFAVGIGFIVIQNALSPRESQIAQANTATEDKQASNEIAESTDQDGSNANVALDSDAKSPSATPADSNQEDNIQENNKTDSNAQTADRKERSKESDVVTTKNESVDNDKREDSRPVARKRRQSLEEDKSDEFSKKDKETVTTEELSDAPTPLETAPKPTTAQADKPRPPIVSRGGTTSNRAKNAEKLAAGKTINKAVPSKRQVGGKTFNRKNGVWTDSAYKGQKTTNVKRNSANYKKLDSGLRSITDKISGTVVVVWKSKAYKIQ